MGGHSLEANSACSSERINTGSIKKNRQMLTLDSLCIPVVIGVILSQARLNGQRINKKLVLLSVFYGTIVSNTNSSVELLDFIII